MRINIIYSGLLWLLVLMATQCWASDALPFPKEPQVPTAPVVTHIDIDAQPIFKSHKQLLPQAWVLHVVTTGNAKLVEQLQTAGFNAYLSDDGKTLLVGPSTSQQQLLQEQKQLQQKFKLSSTVEDYQITWPTQKEH